MDSNVKGMKKPQEKTHTRLYIPTICWGISLFFFSAMNLKATNLIALYFPDRPRPDDLLFRLLPMWDQAAWLADFVVIISGITFVIWLLRTKSLSLGEVFYILTCIYACRGILVLLTPLANPVPQDLVETLLPKNHGMFTSGHIGLTCSFVIMCTSRYVRKFLLFLVCLEVVFLILGRGHYSIDIVGGFLLAWFVCSEAPKYMPFANRYIESKVNSVQVFFSKVRR